MNPITPKEGPDKIFTKTWKTTWEGKRLCWTLHKIELGDLTVVETWHGYEIPKPILQDSRNPEPTGTVADDLLLGALTLNQADSST